MTFALLAAASLAGAAPVFVDKPCADPRLSDLARCGTIAVPENRAIPEGRSIALNVVVLKALPGETALPPLFDFDGGPGLHATKNAGFYATAGTAYRAGREIVLLDQRGTGESNPLTCPELASPERAYEPMLAAEDVRRCRAELEKKADLTRYGTSDAVADVDDVRRALGYDLIDIFALSYGTTVALRYMKVYPGLVRAAVLTGLAPADARPPRSHAPAAQSALELLFAACEREAGCAAAFDPAKDLEKARTRLASIATAPPIDVFMEKLRTLMYQPTTARLVPLILHRAAQGDLGPFLAATRPRGPSPFADGMFLSVTCAEGLALTDVPEARAVAATTAFGDYRLRRQSEACALWPTGKVAADHLEPVSTAVSILLISGELDPVTPPEWADVATSRLPRARHIKLPGSGHVFDGMSGVEDCLDPLMVAFLRTGDAGSLDASCVTRMKPPPFALQMPTAQATTN